MYAISIMEIPKKVLVVDDEKDIGFLMTMMLKAEGYDVRFVQTLNEAKAALRNDTFHMVFLDLNLDHEYGLDLVPEIRNQETPPAIAIITAQKEERVRKDVEASNVDFLIEKPFNKSKILEVLNSPQ